MNLLVVSHGIDARTPSSNAKPHASASSRSSQVFPSSRLRRLQVHDWPPGQSFVPKTVINSSGSPPSRRRDRVVDSKSGRSWRQIPHGSPGRAGPVVECISLVCPLHHAGLPITPHASTSVSWSSFLLLPFGAGAIRGVYVTVLVTTSRMWRTVDLDSRLEPVTAALAVLGVVEPEADADAAAPGTSVKRLDLSAASQSNGDRMDRALHGVFGESTPPQFASGEVGMIRLGKLRFVAGADMGY